MTTKHFDVIVLGRSIGALTAAALLARRDFTVLVLGQGERAPAYRLDKRTLLRVWANGGSHYVVVDESKEG